MILVTVAVMIAPASAYFSSQNVETKAEKMVDIAENALDAVMNIVETVEADTNDPSMLELITDAGLIDDFYGNVSVCVEEGTLVNGVATTENGTGWEALNASKEALLVAVETEDYEEVIDNARDALEIFRDVLKALNGILIDSGIETEGIVDVKVLQEAIERSQEKIDTLVGLLADEELLAVLDEAQGNLTLALDTLPDDVDTAKDYLQTANELISEVCQNLKTIAQDLNPGRIRSYLQHAYQNRERVRERMRNNWNNQEDIDAFLQGLGYENEEEFMERFQEMIQNAEDAENVKDAVQTLNEISKMVRNTGNALAQKTGNKGNNQMPGNGNGFGNMGGANSP